MRACPSCGQMIQKSSLFCGTCGAKIPSEGKPTAVEAPIKIQDHVDPLASTAPASKSPAADLLKKRAAEAAAAPVSEARVSPRAETGFRPASEPPTPGPLSPASPSALGSVGVPPGSPSQNRPSSRGKTVPLSAMANPPAVARPFAVNASKPIVPAGPPIAPAAPLPFAPGARVFVQWANGQRYPGVVDRVNGPQCLVRFDVGDQRWVESRFVLPAK